MAHSILLSDEDYAALVAASTRSGEPIDALVHAAIAKQFAPMQRRPQVGSYEYPTGERDTPEEESEDEHLAASIGPEKPWLSDMVIEDRGPR